MLDLKALLSKILQKLTMQTWTPSITRTGGASISKIRGYKYGDIINITFTLTYTTSVAGGSNVFTGTLNSSSYYPQAPVCGVGYYGKASVVAQINTNGAITVRNASSSAITLSSGTTISVTYIHNGGGQ